MTKNNKIIEEKIRRISRSLLGLKPLPTIIARIIGMIDDPRTNASDLGKVISTDQVLTTKVLRLANSAYYGLPRRIGTIELAVVVLGFDALKDVALSVSLLNRFSNISQNTKFDMSLFWEHSITCGIISKMLAEKYSPELKGEAFVAGLLHDIGKLIVIEYLNEEFEEIHKIIKKEQIAFHKAEKKILNINHAEIGSWLAERSNLPIELVDSIGYHHSPHKAKENNLLPTIVYFSNYLVKKFKYGFSGNVTLKYNEAVLSKIRLKRTDDGKIDFDFYRKKTEKEIQNSEVFIGIIQESQMKKSKKKVEYINSNKQ